MSNINSKKRSTDRNEYKKMSRSFAALTQKKVTIVPTDPDLQAAVVEAETGGPKGPEPTRYGDWERKGRCIDF